MITVITPTGGRPEAFARCVEQVQAQTFVGTVRWVVVDDCREATDVPSMIGDWNVKHIRREPYWQPGQNTLAANLLAALPYATDRVAIMEDDDHYEPWWLTACMERLDRFDLVGESKSLYVHQRTGRRTEMKNTQHASLCSTAFKGDTHKTLRQVCEDGAKCIDVELWRRTLPHFKRLYDPVPRGVIGLKGWPGRPGIGVGHRLA